MTKRHEEKAQHYAMATQDGAIQQTISGPYLYIPCDESVSDTTHYVDAETHEIKAKRALEIHQGISGLTVTLAGLPAGLRVQTNGMETVTDDDPLVIEYDVPGTYQLRLTGHIEYLAHAQEVTVEDA